VLGVHSTTFAEDAGKRRSSAPSYGRYINSDLGIPIWRGIVESISIGLDIGSSAVRAAELEVRPGKRILRRYGQVGLPPGYVVDGEVVNQLGVAEALRRLWSDGGFSSNRVILGVSGPRVFVRQAEVPAMNRDDLRSSLRFNAQELVPIALEEASFDFSVLAEPAPGEGAEPEVTILLVAAHQDVLRTYLSVLKMAGLSATAMDSSALALVRAVPINPAGVQEGGMDVIVSVGAELTTVAVRDHGVPKFIRSLTVGGAKLTSSIADSMHLEFSVAERLKRGAVPSETPQLPQVRRALTHDIRDLAEDIRATVDFFAAQSDDHTLERLLITGGASQTVGLAASIGGDLPVDVYRIDPFAGFDTSQCGLSEEELAKASSTAATAIGLALWPSESPIIRLSVLPEEVFRIQRARRLMRAGTIAVLALGGLLGFAGAVRYLHVQSALSAAHKTEDQATALTAQVPQLQAKTALHGQMLSRGGMEVQALTGDVDYVRVLGQLAAVMPSSLHITSATMSRQASSASGSHGTLNVSVTGTGDSRAAANWLTSLQKDPDLAGTWVGGISIATADGGQTVNFSSSTNLTATAQSTRQEAVKP
jgi:type IV pilus assembly protein PilM